MIDLQTQAMSCISEGKHAYLYSPNIPQTLLIHPLLKIVLDMRAEGVDLRVWVNGLENFGCLDIKGEKTSRKELEYYIEYSFFLEAHGYLKDIKKSCLKDLYIDAEIVKENLRATPQISFEVTERCNLKCEYCGYGELYSGYEDRIGRDLPLESAKSFIAYIMKLKESASSNRLVTSTAVTFYGGEPLLNFEFIKEIVKYIDQFKSIYTQFIFNMTTNAVLLDKHIEYLVENRFFIAISLDGDEMQNSFRRFPNGESTYGKIVGNVMMLKEEFPDYYNDYVSFVAVLHSKNSKKKVADFFRDKFKKEVLFSDLVEVNVKATQAANFKKILGRQSTSEDSKENKKKTLRPTINDTLKTFMRKYSGYVYHRYAQLLYQYSGRLKVLTGTCSPFQKRVFLTAGGKILTCEKVPHFHELGKVKNGKVNIDFDGVARHYDDLYKGFGNLCDRCNNSKYCQKCLFLLPNNSGNQPECNNFVGFDTYLECMSKFISVLEKYPHLYAQLLRRTRIQ